MIEIPQKFKNDIEGKTFSLVPLIIIDDRLYLSTMKVKLENTYIPLIKKIGSINQSIDMKNKNFKISNLSVNCYTSEYNNQTLSDQLFSPSVINKKIEIYYMTPSAESIEDCLKVYMGTLKEIKENSSDLTIYAEDETEKTMNKDLPIEYVRDDVEVPDKYKNKRVPMVYGFVENAPCVYYNVYESAIQNGSTKYSITPDSFAIQSVEGPKVFENDIYIPISETSLTYAQFASETLYSSSLQDQYYILSSMILVDKQLRVKDGQDSEQGPSNTTNLDASPIAYNMVAVTQDSDVVFLGGNYDLHYEGNKKSANVQMFKDVAGEIPSKEVNGSYLDVKDFGEIPEEVANPEYWLFGPQNQLADLWGYTNIYGETVLNFEASPFASENKIVKTLPTGNGEKTVGGWVSLLYNLEAEVLDLYGATPPHSQLPHLYFRWGDVGADLWSVHTAHDMGGGILRKSNSTQAQLTNVISNRVFSIGQRKLDSDGDWVLEQDQKDGFKYLKTVSLKIRRQAILKDFISYDIYADVFGRVDNVSGTYTGTPQLTSEQRQDYYNGRSYVAMETTGRPARRQVATAVKPPKKPMLRKQKTETRSKY